MSTSTWLYVCDLTVRAFLKNVLYLKKKKYVFSALFMIRILSFHMADGLNQKHNGTLCTILVLIHTSDGFPCTSSLPDSKKYIRA